jgi:hypothetical protein
MRWAVGCRRTTWHAVCAALIEEAPQGSGLRGYRCACEPAAVGQSPVRTTQGPTGWLTVVRPVWFS